MRNVLTAVLMVAPLGAFGQYIGNPGGKAFPLGAVGRGFRVAHGFAGIEGGYVDQDVDAQYNAVTNGVPRVVSTTSRLQESYFALFGGTHIEGFELDARIGGSFQTIKEQSFTEDPYDDGGGLLIGASGRWGFSPVKPLRLGLGGQFSYTYSEGDAVVSDGGGSYREDIQLDLFRGQLFTGLGLDLAVGKGVTLSPYGGVAAEFLDADLEIKHYTSSCCYWREEVGDLDEDRIELFFGGLDLFVTDQFRAGVEGRGNGAGWGVTTSVSWRF
jgi:hypothetical protein